MSDYSVSKRLELFPTTARLAAASGDEHLTIAGCDLADLAERHGTPVYLYDQATLDHAVNDYRDALRKHYPGETGLTYAGKAFLCVALAQWAISRELWLDCTGAGELEVARVAGVRREQIVLHGVNKSTPDLTQGLTHAGTIVVDNLAELKRLAPLAERRSEPLPDLWLRLRPGVAVAAHAHTQTGHEDSKFGMDRAEAIEAVRFCTGADLPLSGLHFHLGSQFGDPFPIGLALEFLLNLVAFLNRDTGWSPAVVCPGGGWGCAYHEDGLPHPPIEQLVRYLAERLAAGFQRHRLPLPALRLEPGRSLVARAGVALYRVGTVKGTAGRSWLLLDGGLADNPRPALYGTRYTALPVRNPGRPPSGPAWIAGPYCETGDVLIEALFLPSIGVGELLAVPMSGAYQLSMASNYNGARRPAILWLRDGQAHLIQSRERVTDLHRRDIPLNRV